MTLIFEFNYGIGGGCQLTLVMIDEDNDSNRARVMEETAAGIEWKGRMDNASEGGGGTWWRNIGNDAKDENAQLPSIS